MLCKKCGNEFEGQFCNNCGTPANETNTQSTPYHNLPIKPKKKKGGSIKLGLIAIACVFGLGVLGALLGDKDAPSSTTPSSATPVVKSSAPEIQIIEITAKELLKKYDENQVNADNLYKGKLIAVTGVIGNIGKDILDDAFVTLSSGEDYSIISVQCYFKDKAELEKVAALKQGDNITIVGTCTGSTLNVLLKNSKIQ